MLYIKTNKVISNDNEVKDIQTIYIHRGDRGTITYTIDIDDNTTYEFKSGDVVEFTVFEKSGYNKVPVINKKIEIDSPVSSIQIDLTEEETTIGDRANKPVTYWYEIKLNGVVVNGYDYDEGVSEFILMPAKDGEDYE